MQLSTRFFGHCLRWAIIAQLGGERKCLRLCDTRAEADRFRRNLEARLLALEVAA